MKRLVIITTILLVAAGYITVAYFKNLNPPGLNTSQVIRSIPNNAALILEYPHEKSFYDIFSENKLPAAVLGPQAIADLDTLRIALRNTPLRPFFTGQNLFVSVHPSAANTVEYLLTLAPKKDFTMELFNDMATAHIKDILVTPLKLHNKSGYTLYLKSIKKRFYIINKGSNILTGSFSKELVELSARYDNKKDAEFDLLPARQNTNALANLYVNYRQFNTLFKLFFKYETGMLKELRAMPATAVLSLNYKRDALMFNGLTTVNPSLPPGYLQLFIKQLPVQNRLKSIFPSTTAYFSNFAVSDSRSYTNALSQWHKTTAAGKQETQLLNTVERESGVNIQQAFNEALGNEFAVITTRYQEKIGIIAIKNGARLNPVLLNISSEMSDNSGRFNYDKLPYFLLGDSFEIFRKPYFMIIDNYLILANSYKEIESYYESYINRKFLVKMEDYSRFDNLMAQKSNVSFYVDLENARSVFKRDMNKDIFNIFESNEPGWKDLSGASYQLTASGDGFYTNFCIGMATTNDDDLLPANKN